MYPLAVSVLLQRESKGGAEGLLKDRMAADGGEGDEADGKAGLGRPSSHGKGPAEGKIMLLH